MNDTIHVEFSDDEYILQKINTTIFTKPYELMENVEMVTEFLKEKIIENGSLSDLEIDLFPAGAKMMTLESAIRFLTDYLEGDTYFKTDYEDHNLVRARTQIKLVQEMDRQWDAMNTVVKKHKEA